MEGIGRLRSFDVVLISAEELTIGNRLINGNAFVTIHPDSDGPRTSTNVDKDGGGFPRWNEKMRLDLPPSSWSIVVTVRCKTSMGVRNLGVAIIPVSDFCNRGLPLDYLHFLSYRLRDDNGKRNEIVNLSVRMSLPDIYFPPPPPPVSNWWAVGREMAQGMPLQLAPCLV